MSHTHIIRDDDLHLIIDPDTRLMSNESGNAITLMQYDHNSERITFEIPKVVEGHDMSLSTKVKIHYVNAGTGTSVSVRTSNVGLYEVDDLDVAEDDPDTLVFSWLISQNATQLAGSIKIQIEFVCDDNGSLELPSYIWRTSVFSSISVLPGLDATGGIVEQYPDVLEKWKKEVIDSVGSGGGTSDDVDDRLSELENAIADLNYTAITINSFSVSPSVVEIGSSLNSVALSWSTNKTPTALTLDGVNITASSTSKTVAGTFSSNKTWTLKATDERDATATRTATLSFLNRVIWGVATEPTEIDDDFLLNLEYTLASSRSRTFSVNAGSGRYVYYCVPTRMGTCSFKVGGFDGGFTLVDTYEFCNESGYTENYYIYRSDNAGLGATTVTVS